MTNEEKASKIAKQHKLKYTVRYNGITHTDSSESECFNSALEMAQWKDEQLGWYNAKKEQPPMDEEVIVLTNILNGKELSTPRRICFAHIVDKNICVDYDGWNIPGVAYWMYYKEPK